MWGSTRLIQLFGPNHLEAHWNNFIEKKRKEKHHRTTLNRSSGWPSVLSSFLWPPLAQQWRCNLDPLGFRRDSGSSTKFTSESSLNHAMQALGHMIKSSVGQHVTCDNKIITKYTKTDQRIGIELGLWSWNGWHVVVECNATIFHYSWSWWTTPTLP